MKVAIYGGEGFPIYSVHSDGFEDEEIDIDEETLKRWKVAFDNFTKIQNEIIKKLNSEDKDYWSCHSAWEGFDVEL